MTPGEAKPRLPPLWWERWPGRLEAEVQSFGDRNLTAEYDPPDKTGRFVIRTTCRLRDGSTTPVTVVYPDGYPDRRFAVYAPELRLTRHEAFGGNLCVFPRGAEHWDPTTLAGDVVADTVPELVQLVLRGGSELRAREDPQGEPTTTYYPYFPTGAIVLDARLLSVSTQTTSGHITIACDGRGSGWLADAADAVARDTGDLTGRRVGQAAVVSLIDHTGAELLSGSPLLPERYSSEQLTGRWARLRQAPWAETADELWDAVEEALRGTPRGRRIDQGHELLGLVVQEEVAHETWADAWVFLIRRITAEPVRRSSRQKKGPTPKRVERTVASPAVIRGTRWTQEDLAVRIPELAPIRERSVLVAGLGSLGAPLAIEFAKAQIGRLGLLDADHIDPATAVRHPLGLEYAGQLKPLALAQALMAQWPATTYGLTATHIGSAGMDGSGEREDLGQALNGVDLMVSATAEDDVNRQLDRAAADLNIPRLHAWRVSGYGGVVALLRPGVTGCYHCLELLEADRSAEQQPLVRAPEDDDARRIQGRGCGDRRSPATTQTSCRSSRKQPASPSASSAGASRAAIPPRKATCSLYSCAARTAGRSNRCGPPSRCHRIPAAPRAPQADTRAARAPRDSVLRAR